MKTIYTLIFCLIFTATTQAKHDVAQAFAPVEALFAAVSARDHEAMRDAVTESFLLLEHGEVWTIQDFINVVKPSDYVRTNHFSIISSHITDDNALINYWNKANFDNKKNSQDMIWLESVVVKKVAGQWRLLQMHSTRLPMGTVPEGVDFSKQKTP